MTDRRTKGLYNPGLNLTPDKPHPAFWWTFTGFVALVAMQAVYWVIAHPVNKFWLKDAPLKGVAGGHFAKNEGSDYV